MVQMMATKEEKEHLLKLFSALDLNGDGQLSKEELENGYIKIMGSLKAKEEVERIMKNVDLDNNEFIDYMEFVAATMNKKEFLSNKRLTDAFKMFD